MPACYRFLVRGRVQGVGFRVSAVREAERRGLGGWVCNREDGAVEGLAQGDERELAGFRDWLAQGPPLAQVESVQWNAEPPPAPVTAGFAVRR